MAFEPPPYLSPSSINTFLQCPLKFKFSKIDGIREPATEATLMGNFVHDVLEALYLLPGSSRTILASKVLAKELWETKYIDQVNEVVEPQKINDFRWKSWFCIENLWQVEDPTSEEMDGIEYEINCSVEGIVLKGFVDRYQMTSDGIKITDYKTGKIPAAKWQSDKFFQLYIYAAGLEELGVGEVNELELLYLKGPKTLSTKVDKKILEETKVKIKTVKSEIDECCKKEKFKTKTSVLCGWCYFKPNCPAWRK
jgi:putative RecB family exonuclease